MHYLYITPDRISVGHATDDGGQQRVGVTMDYDAKDAPWLAPDIRLAMSMTPAEARSLARALERTADEAEATTLQ